MVRATNETVVRIGLREDQIDSFLHLPSKRYVTWKPGPLARTGGPGSFARREYHATLDGETSICPTHLSLSEENDPCPGIWDRSQDDDYTCQACQEDVARIITDPARLVERRVQGLHLASLRAWKKISSESQRLACASGKTSSGTK
jgi:hypothetical protein